jgi:hypothetical protein
MNNYLRGYLASIPKSEYNNMINFLKDNITDKVKISEDEFEALLTQIVENATPATTSRAPKENEKPSDTYNDFFANVYIDLNYLFKVINLLYNAADSYSTLSASYLTDIKSEIDKLETTINELETREKYSSTAAVVTETFKDTEYFEDYDDSTSYLFCDRNGDSLPTVNLVHNNTSDMIILNTTIDRDLLHDKDGKPRGKIELLDYRGTPCDTYCITSNAIDNSVISYWDTSVSSDEPINIPMGDLESGGAYIKFKVNLPAVYDVTEVSLTPYCVYPVELCDVTIGDTSVVNTAQTSVDTIVTRSVKVSSDEITFVLRQKNYVHSTDVTNEKEDEAKELWNRALDKSKETYVTNEKLTTDSEIYKYYSALKERDITEWNKAVIKDKEMIE